MGVHVYSKDCYCCNGGCCKDVAGTLPVTVPPITTQVNDSTGGWVPIWQGTYKPDNGNNKFTVGDQTFVNASDCDQSIWVRFRVLDACDVVDDPHCEKNKQRYLKNLFADNVSPPFQICKGGADKTISIAQIDAGELTCCAVKAVLEYASYKKCNAGVTCDWDVLTQKLEVTYNIDNMPSSPGWLGSGSIVITPPCTEEQRYAGRLRYELTFSNPWTPPPTYGYAYLRLTSMSKPASCVINTDLSSPLPSLCVLQSSCGCSKNYAFGNLSIPTYVTGSRVTAGQPDPRSIIDLIFRVRGGDKTLEDWGDCCCGPITIGFDYGYMRSSY